jgi:hypothetical protein
MQIFASNTSAQAVDFKLDASQLRCCAEPTPVELMLYAGNNLDKAREIFAA